MDSNYIIETKNLTKQYGSQKSVADLNIHVKRGRIYGLLGRNGAGKTTTMKMLLGLTKPTSGEVKIWGKSLQGNEKKLLPRIGSLIESPGFYPNLTGTENLRIFATLRGVPNNHAIKDKSGDIAVLRTLGAKDGLIRAIFVWYGLLAGSVGSLFGVVIGVICALNLTSIINGIEYLIGHKFLSGDIYFIDFLPSELHWLDVFYVLVTALLLSLLASWYPARKGTSYRECTFAGAV